MVIRPMNVNFTPQKLEFIPFSIDPRPGERMFLMPDPSWLARQESRDAA